MLARTPEAERKRLNAIIRLGATVQQRSARSYTVASQSEAGVRHTVVFDQQGRAHCSCVANREYRKACSHISATFFWLEMQQTEQRAA